MMEKEKILDKTNRGYDIFTHYLGKDVQRKLFVNPFRGDKSPSCRLYYNKRNGGIWIMKDYGASEWSGDCFSVVAKSMNINPMTDFRELLTIIRFRRLRPSQMRKVRYPSKPPIRFLSPVS